MIKKISIFIIASLFLFGTFGYLNSKYFRHEEKNNLKSKEIKKYENNSETAEDKEINIIDYSEIIKCSKNSDDAINILESCYIDINNNIIKFIVTKMNESKTLSNITIFINDKKFLSIKEMENGNFYNFLSIDNLIVFCYHNGTDIRSEYYVIVSLNAEIIMSGKEFDFQNLSGMVLNKNSKKGPLYIESNSLFLEGTRITHGPSVIFEGQMKNLSEINLNEIVIATYKFKYLGNSKFDAPFIIESITAKTFCENYEDGYNLCMNP